MSFSSQPMQPGMLHDAAVRVASNGSTSEEHDVISELGWPLVLLPEEIGGLGGSLEDLTALVEGLSAYASSLPVIERCAIAPLLLQAGGNTSWLADLADGKSSVAPLVCARSHDLGRHTLEAQPTDDGYLLKGEMRGVDALSSVTHWVAVAQLGSDLAIFVVEASQMPAPESRYSSMDGRLSANFCLNEIKVPASHCIAKGVIASQAVARASQAALAMICVDSVSVLGAMVEHTVNYLNSRVQFGVTLSTFQALRHQLVNVYMCYESGRGMVTNFLEELGRDPSADARRLSLVKLALGESARYSAETVIQLHGGMGMTQEMLAARLAQRLLTNEFRYGDRFTHSALLTLSH